ncbi:MAG TPA: hypothetical protein VFK10_15180, partial [Burkholderiaceae bacterium]|nr:hypothetical protein [Burkholderiaceae bacterium]
MATAIGVAMPAHSVLPLVAGLGKQLIKNMLIDGVKSQLMGSLAEMGCKGSALASVLASSGGGRVALAGGMPGLPAGLSAMRGGAMPGGIPAIPAIAGTIPNSGDAMAMRAARTAGAMPTLPAGIDPRTIDASQMNALMQQMAARGGGTMPTMSPQQMGQMSATIASLQQAMAQPLSRAETLAVFDELAVLGVTTPAMDSEARDCVTLAPPEASASLGASAALLKNMVLPQLRAAREQMAGMTPEQREQMADEIAQAMKDASPED